MQFPPWLNKFKDTSSWRGSLTSNIIASAIWTIGGAVFAYALTVAERLPVSVIIVMTLFGAVTALELHSRISEWLVPRKKRMEASRVKLGELIATIPRRGGIVPTWTPEARGANWQVEIRFYIASTFRQHIVDGFDEAIKSEDPNIAARAFLEGVRLNLTPGQLNP